MTHHQLAIASTSVRPSASVSVVPLALTTSSGAAKRCIWAYGYQSAELEERDMGECGSVRDLGVGGAFRYIVGRMVSSTSRYRAAAWCLVLGGPMAIVSATVIANATATYESPYGYDRTWNAAVRLVRVDNGWKVTEKDDVEWLSAFRISLVR